MRTLLLILGYLIADSALTDPCEHHTVLDQPWRSTNCSGTQCYHQVKCDAGLAHGWYRFKSSGGWEIPETQVPDHHCSTHVSGWLTGSHPTVGQGQVERTVCFTQHDNPCRRNVEIKIKNCNSYFVYELKPTYRCNMAYCTDPKTVPNQEPEEHSTRDLADRSSSSPAGSASSDPETFPTQEPEEQSTRESADRTTTIPVVSTASDTETFPTEKAEEKSTRVSVDLSSTVQGGSGTSDPETSPTLEPKEQITPDSADRTTTIPAGSAATDTETFPTEKTEQKSTRVSVDLSSTVPGGSGTSDNRYKRIDVHITSMTEFDDETAKKIALEQVKKMFKDQCPDVKFDLSPDDVQCSASDPPEE